ncbi:hypothetical protein DRN58_08555 [Thermococci archaeon]|nr:MAG: hypothetical protein DRN58_08555 [Thermococci archaeon]
MKEKDFLGMSINKEFLDYTASKISSSTLFSIFVYMILFIFYPTLEHYKMTHILDYVFYIILIQFVIFLSCILLNMLFFKFKR